MSQKNGLIVIAFIATLALSFFLVSTAKAQTTTPIIAAFYTKTPCNPMLAGEVELFSHSTGSPQKIVWTVTCPDGTTITQETNPKFNFFILGEYQVSLTVTRILNGITETDTLTIPGYVKVIDNPLNLHPPQSLRE